MGSGPPPPPPFRTLFISTPGKQNIVPGIANMQASDLAKTRAKFEIAYFIAKEELPLKK
jgi:hypothetical protein